MQKFNIQNVVILGAGVMGSQIAAHCINAGLKVKLLDLKSDDEDRPNKIAEEAIQKLQKMNPAPLTISDWADRITPGNFEDHLDWISNSDWVCEVIIERMDIKKEMMSKIEKVRKPGTIISSNTSGLPISEIGEDCSEEFRSHFLGTHFFNPPRYMKLLEIIPTQDTSEEVVEYMTGFCEKILGKGIVQCNDTPNFIANRIGVFSMASIMPWFFDGKFRIEEIDELTGTLTGYSKAATFRTADMAGLDVLNHVAENLLPAVPDDERREIFELPDSFKKMVDEGAHGNKTGHGFYKKVQTDDGKEYHVINSDNLEYEPQKEVHFDSVKEAKKKFKTPEERLKYLVNQDDEVGKFLWEIHCDLLLYSANRISEITDSVESIDRAMQWGFNWELGPFQRWDAIGIRESVKRMASEGREVPDSVKEMLDSGRDSFYVDGTVYNLVSGEAESIPPPANNAITVNILKNQDQEVWGNKSAGLYDMGDGIALFEFRTKQQTLGFELVQSVEEACEIVKEKFDGLVIGHDHENFSYGANLAEAGHALKEGEFSRVKEAVENFQRVAVGLRYQPFPVVAAVSGRTFGGGVEFMMHCDKVVAHHELYAGLVELGVGLIPAGGGTKELLLRAMEKVQVSEDADPLPYLKHAFKTIGLAKVSDSAHKAIELGYLRPSDVIVMNRDLILNTARDHARILSDQGYRPPAEPKIKLTGKTGFSALNIMLYIMSEGNYASDYDKVLTRKVATVLTGGDISESQEVPESAILKLEREAILECFRDKRTHKRMEHMLKTGKPLRN
ncbi:3-hydroxyacyl-CoA dehydrogenase/enoyl-CoA hydratase family protein [Rhodohalobacter sulfatireducens]|uniref:3-hydroxyacyl-CoA dehydrogenase/enoyl-CoA hydratase family protein n=1 Tax=Rhodohalobacter sulfatireducens TaxID=2911366 RepID=A0ABS9KDG7_9BACT|nr:3-hydroxyacyl-CoA dehydrogenase/enoyl-CoA hydratase family protein [Rhodohalobacter sulfatireducens]MCG2588904.1 3-hydroxyacyl-CoA dehydrogenase/enoyl-CoA hydratase family protein [Rhodohalobacter sulfatireducens]